MQLYKNLEENNESLGIICPYYVGNFPDFKLKDFLCDKEKSYNIDYVEFKYIGSYSTSKKSFNRMFHYHITVMNDMNKLSDRKK